MRPRSTTGQRRRAPRVLVIDTDEATRRLVQDLLGLHGYQVHVTADSDAGLAAFHDLRPDCVLIDFRTPEPDGHELLRALRRSPGGRSTVMVMLSTTSDEDSWHAWDSGPDLYLAKPFDTEQLLSFLRSHIGSRSLALPSVAGPAPATGSGASKVDGAVRLCLDPPVKLA
jgi:DNA-binding response OmpR family regulator